MTSLLLLALVSIKPYQASHVAAYAVGDPSLADDLVRICRRESRCEAIGIHARDARFGRRAWKKAVSKGLLDPATCEHHRRGEPSRWATRGAWGTMAAYTLPYLGGCLPPEILDVPIVGAMAAALRLKAAKKTRVPALSRWAGRKGIHA